MDPGFSVANGEVGGAYDFEDILKELYEIEKFLIGREGRQSFLYLLQETIR